MGNEDSYLSGIPRFSQITNFSSEQMKGASDKDRGVVYQVAQQVLQELNNSAHAPKDRQTETEGLGRFIHNMEAIAPKPEDRSPAATAFRATLVQLRAHQSGASIKSDKMYTFYTAPDAAARAGLAGGDAARRERISNTTGSFIDALIRAKELGGLPESDLDQIYRNFCAIGAEMAQAQDPEALASFAAHVDRFAAVFGYVPLSAFLKKEELASRIQERISQLSLSSSGLREDIRKIKEDIAQLKGLLTKQSAPQAHLDRLDLLGKALDELMHPQLSKISEAEYEIFREAGNVECEEEFSNYSPQKKRELIERELLHFAEREKVSMQEEREEVLKRLQSAAPGGLRNLVNQAPKFLDGIREAAVRDRFKSFENTIIKPGFSDKAFELTQNIETYGRFIERSLHEMWKTRLHSQRFDALGEPSQRQAFFDKYPYANPLLMIEKTKQQAIRERMRGLPLDANAPASFKESCREHETRHKKLFAENSPDASRMKWLTDQAQNIRIPYSQASDLLVNRGACFSNSLHRCSLALQNPRSELVPGASPVTRMRQIAYISEPRNLPQRGEFATSREKRIAEKYGLSITDQKMIWFKETTIPPTPAEEAFVESQETTFIENQALGLPVSRAENHDQLVKEIRQFSQRHPMIVVNMFSFKTGHSFNVQMSAEENIYRIIDDNVGLCEFRSEEELFLALGELFDSFYGSMKAVELYAYERLPEPPK